MKLKDRVALITGSGGGIGRAIALVLSRRGCHLALVDINEEALLQTAEQAQLLGVQVTTHPLDVADREAIRQLPAAVHAAHGRLDVLINNAGVALGGTFEQVSEADFDWLMEINFHAVVRLTRACLPLLHQSDNAQIVNMSSLYGLISPPGQTAYSASKFAVRGFSNALRHELEGTPIGVSVVHPGGVATAIAKSARVPGSVSAKEIEEERSRHEKMLRMTPEKAGEIIVRGLEQRQARILVGADAKAVALLERLLPVRYWSILKQAFRN
ncbi:SDR family NAD(P)-dependent oxidoreductase [Hymenobacter wooponensis]|uniref:SDR family oxidoreductase n=1 Tax=Hymenobacter wooponensis TaxID=1525360 RepID=A0A4Z0MTS8_9BACT|nr:SDR family oxidoreductase [Hymenobacter wooponensis]TGD82718.1 SDR family oxidoreductase [Hymenobacter wooponensis]